MTIKKSHIYMFLNRIIKMPAPQILTTLFLLCITLLHTLDLTRANAMDQSLNLTPDEITWLEKNKNNIRYGPNPHWPPGDYMEDGKHKGIVSDYIKIFEKKLGITFERVYYNDWGSFYKGLMTGEFDLVGACQETEERKKVLVFTKPFLKTRLGVLTRRNSPALKSLNDINSMTIAGIRGYSSLDYVRSTYPGAKIVECEDDLTVLLKVSAGAADGAVLDYMMASYLVDKYSITNINYAIELDYHWDLRFAINKKMPQLRTMLDKVLSTIDENERQKIYHKWVTIKLEQRPNFIERHLKIITGLFLFVLFILFVVLLFNRSLKQQVFIRTKELRESEERFKFLSEATVEGVHIHDNGVVLDGNLAFAKMIGYDSVEEIIGMRIMPKYLTPESLKKAQDYITSGYEGSYEVVGLKRDGTQIPLEIISRKIEFNGQTVRVVATRDITEHKAAEKFLQWNVRRNEILSETASMLLQSDEPQNHISDLCKKVMGFLNCQVFFHFIEDADTGKLHLNACAGVPKDKLAEIEWLNHGAAVCGTVAQTRQAMICDDILDSSDPLTVLIKSFGIQTYCCCPLMIKKRLLGTLSFGKTSEPRFQPGEIEIIKSIANLVAVAVNRIRTEKEKIDLETQLRHAQKVEAVGRLAGGVAHDLNNLLCPILNYAQMLTEDLNAGDKRREYAVEIENAAIRSRDLVRQLLAFSRKQVITLKPLDLNKAIRGIEKLLLRTIPEDIQLKKRLSQEIRPVLADIGQIEQILMNLTVNAADAMPDGGLLTIETGLSELDDEYIKMYPGLVPGQYVMLSVSDTGSGMDDDTLTHVFEPFFSTKGEKGTGLGLATVYGIVKQHNGNIRVSSEPEMGTTFEIYFPTTMEIPLTKGIVQQKKSVQKGAETILLVEDNERVRHLSRTILERQGYKVLEAENGDKGLHIMSSHDSPIHLLLTDVVMPGMNGRELYETAVQKRPDLKVIYMSGYSDDIIAHRGVVEKGIQLIQKPFSIDELAAKIKEVLHG